MMRGSRKNMTGYGGDGVEDESSTPVLRYGESGACRLGVGWSGLPRLTWASRRHRPTTRVKNRAGIPYAGMWVGMREATPMLHSYTLLGQAAPKPGDADAQVGVKR
jgi:hypothetical protein